MPLTRDFKETVKARAETDAVFRANLLSEATELLLKGDADTGRLMIRDYINATIGFERLAAEVGKPSKSIMRMFGPSGNPTAESLFNILVQLQLSTGVRLTVAPAA